MNDSGILELSSQSQTLKLKKNGGLGTVERVNRAISKVNMRDTSYIRTESTVVTTM